MASKNVDADGDSTRARLLLVGPGDGVIADHGLPELDFHEGQKRLRRNLNLQGLEIRAAGMHRVAIETLGADDEWHRAATTPFEISEPPVPDEGSEDAVGAALALGGAGTVSVTSAANTKTHPTGRSRALPAL